MPDEKHFAVEQQVGLVVNVVAPASTDHTRKIDKVTYLGAVAKPMPTHEQPPLAEGETLQFVVGKTAGGPQLAVAVLDEEALKAADSKLGTVGEGLDLANLASDNPTVPPTTSPTALLLAGGTPTGGVPGGMDTDKQPSQGGNTTGATQEAKDNGGQLPPNADAATGTGAGEKPSAKPKATSKGNGSGKPKKDQTTPPAPADGAPQEGAGDQQNSGAPTDGGSGLSDDDLDAEKNDAPPAEQPPAAGQPAQQ